MITIIDIHGSVGAGLARPKTMHIRGRAVEGESDMMLMMMMVSAYVASR